ncbi:vWA domain-containing protein [Ottowia sp.]|uniref:vWA domain-containing protein n=1 Tax=Ottowia sp. TaxID=1898956 RepID=UPI003A899DFE
MTYLGTRRLFAVLIAVQLAACSSSAPDAVVSGATAASPALDGSAQTPLERRRVNQTAARTQVQEAPAYAPAAAPAMVAVAPPPALHAPGPVPERGRLFKPSTPPSVSAVPGPSTERYAQITDNPVKLVAEAPVSTFSIDVDTGSYSNVRRMLNAGTLPPGDAVRVEELINYFPYDYAQPSDGRPFAVHTQMAPAPWNAERVLLRIGIKGQDVAKQSLPPANLVFLVDVSGSMNSQDKLPLLKSSLKLLVDEMRPQDRISLVTYASGTQVVLQPTSGADKARIKAAIDALHAGGSTAGASGIQLAYSAAQQSLIEGGINRILLATDGDFNVGVADVRQLKSMVEQKRKSGISLSTIGFGTGNYNEAMMEQVADVGDGAYSYIDSLMEGHKVLVNEMTSTLATIAKDVKVQIEFNPAVVKEYRLIGYENRQLRREDFNNDQVDAGDIGAGHTVTALYELTLSGAKGSIDPLRYAQAKKADNPHANANANAKAKAKAKAKANELAHLRLRYKLPGQPSSTLIDTPIARQAIAPLASTDTEFRFATAVAIFGQLLRGGRHTGTWSYADARALAFENQGSDRYGYRAEFVRLIDLAQAQSR